MKRLALLFLLTLSIVTAQTTGNVTFSAPAPGKLTVSAGSVTCTIAGNAAPATGVSIMCALGSVTIPAYSMPFIANQAYTFDHRLNGDAVTVILSADATGKISYQASATPNGGTTASGSGTF